MSRPHPMLARLLRAGPSAAHTAAAPDRTLLRDALTRRDPAAFEALVSRHGPTVWGVCRRLLRDHADAEDAFQATFLVLLRNRPDVGELSAVGGWLYRVAYRTALKARTATARRTRREMAAARPEGTPRGETPDDTLTAVHEELAALPDIYRLAVLLCDVEGLSRTDAADRLGWKEGSLSGRLNRGRKLLADRLRARGVVPAVVVGGATVLPPAVQAATVELGLSELGFAGITRAVPPSVAALTRGVLNDMATKYAMKVFAALVLTIGTLAALGVGLTGGPTEPAATAAPVPKSAQPVDPALVTPEYFFLVTHQKIQKELKLSPQARVAIIDGVAEIDEEQAEVQRKQLQDFRAGREGPGGPKSDGPAKDFAALRRTAVARHLTRAEFDRLVQIDRQLSGAGAFIRPDVAAALGLSDKQRAAARDAVQSMFKVLAGKGAGRQAVIPYWNEEEFPEMWTAARDAVLKQLSEAQRKKWDELTGPKLSFDPVKHLRAFGHLVDRVPDPAPDPPAPQVFQPPAPVPGPGLPQVGPFPQAPPQPPRLDDERLPQLPPPMGLTPLAPPGAGTQPPLPPTTLPPIGR